MRAEATARAARLAVSVVTATAASGCLLGPDYARPGVEVPASYGPGGSPAPAPPIEQAWWRLFDDPTLTFLEEEALAANQNLQVALAHVVEARATARITASQFYPVLTFDPSFTAQHLSANRPATGNFQIKGINIKDIQIPFDLSYELDLWGKIRRSVESSADVALATQSDADTVALTLTADVALQYFTLRSLDDQLAILEATIRVYGEQVHVEQIRQSAGIVSDLDLYQAQTQLRSAQAQEADTLRQRHDTEHALAVLCGRAAPDFRIAPATTTAQRAAPEVPAGVPSELLERRPDIASAEANLASANAEIGVAETLFFPSVQIFAVAGLESADAATLFTWPSRAASVGPSISMPIFEGGRLRGNLDAARARYDQAVGSYRQTVLAAFQEVEDALTDVQQRGVQQTALDQAVVAAGQAAKVARIQYQSGIVDYLEVVVTEQARLTLELQQAQVAQQRQIAAVALVKSLGGGWR